MLEIEQKFEVASFQELEKKLASRNVQLAKEEYEVDHYLNAPDRDFAKTGEAFRIRRIGDSNFLTFKGPKLDSAYRMSFVCEKNLTQSKCDMPNFFGRAHHLAELYRSYLSLGEKFCNILT